MNGRRLSPLRLLHWLTAVLVALMIPAVLGAQALTEVNTDRAEQLIGLHMLCGLLILVLTPVRLLLRWLGPEPAAVGEHPAFGVLTGARTVLLYGFLIALPLTGIFKLTLSGLDIMIFGHTVLRAGTRMPAVARSLNGAHAWLAWSFLMLVVLHVGAAAIRRYARRHR